MPTAKRKLFFSISSCFPVLYFMQLVPSKKWISFVFSSLQWELLVSLGGVSPLTTGPVSGSRDGHLHCHLSCRCMLCKEFYEERAAARRQEATSPVQGTPVQPAMLSRSRCRFVG
eukprot:TRINITY_DN282_c0_g1_i7.p1 TRINITY_DN282_c0_g1~~TRINITY_DN282_c0_g1_i7.p1  ORF type:complete len:115 (+),score=7.58 TRINITY_DN282_c0_g1_i7:279-623(+)